LIEKQEKGEVKVSEQEKPETIDPLELKLKSKAHD